MKAKTLPRVNPDKTYLTPLFLLMTLTFSLIFLPQIGRAQQTSLSLADILIGLRSKKASLPEKNQLLTEAVKTRGITFALTGEIEKELGTTGANSDLIAAIRAKAPVVKAAPAPVSTPTPKPVSSAPDFTFYQNQGNSYFVKGNYDLAVASYNKSIELNTKDSTNYMSRGLAYYNKKSFDLAAADYSKAIELSPKDSIMYFKRGDAYEKLGKIDEAIADYEKAVELDAGNDTAKSYLQRLHAEKTKNTPKPQTAEVPKESAPAEEKSAPAKIINRGSLNDLATKLAIPYYPPTERQRQIFGLVTVQISLDEKGNVLSAKALDGPFSLRKHAEDAAEKSKFNPAMLDGKPTKVIGFISYNFKLN